MHHLACHRCSKFQTIDNILVNSGQKTTQKQLKMTVSVVRKHRKIQNPNKSDITKTCSVFVPPKHLSFTEN